MDDARRAAAVAVDGLADSAGLSEREVDRELQRVIDHPVVCFCLDEQTAELTCAGSRDARGEEGRLAAPAVACDDVLGRERSGRTGRGTRSVELPEVVGDVAIDDDQFAISTRGAVRGGRHVNADGAARIAPSRGVGDLYKWI
ncbi:hypothetical protein FQV39_08175 [Bosea sp. F3-2]|nr:hypothetical protein FQV39_08175 [Bosea sp. F3-2]